MKTKLGRLVDIQIGYQVKGKVVSRPNDTHLLVQTGDVNGDGVIAWEALARFTPERKGADRYTLVDGDVLFLAKGAKRVAAVVRNPRPRALAVSTFYILRVRDDAVVLPEYLAWFLNVAAREEIAARELRGTTIVFVPKEVFAALEVELPSNGTQRRIVALDELMRREKRLTAELLGKRTQLVNAAARRAIAEKREEGTR